MFDWFKNRNKDGAEEHKDNVYRFPEPREVPKMPYVVPPVPEPEKPARIFYRLGLTDNDRVAFSMGQMEITMNKEGCQQLIDQVTFFMNQLQDNEDQE